MNKIEIENLLIKAVHSNNDANQFFLENLDNEELFHILLDIAENNFSGDARMSADCYIGKYNGELLKTKENLLLELVKEEEPYRPHIMIALARIKSEEGIKYILNERIKKDMYWEAEALNIYLGFVDENKL